MSTEQIDAELAEIKSLMGDKRSAYWQGAKAETMQKRYEALLEARDSGTAPPPRLSGDAAELLDIKALMGDKRSAYWRGPKSEMLRARYVELLEKLGR